MMQKMIMAAAVFGFVMASGDISSAYEGVLKIEKPLVLKVKSKKVQFPVGEYNSKMSFGHTYGFLGLNPRKNLSFEIETNKGVISGKIKFEKKSENLLEDHDIAAKDATTSQTEIISGEINEVRECVVYSFTTQENCHAEYSYVCNGPKDVDDNCVNGYDTITNIVCDTVHHEIKGIQDVVYQKTQVTVNEKLNILDKKDNSLVAALVVEPEVYASEKIISKGRCHN